MDEQNNPFDPSTDFFGELKDYTPEEVKDEGEFKPLKGSYICRCTKLTHNIGVSTTTNEPYDFYALNMQITEVVSGDKGVNRYFNKRYQNTNEGLKKLFNDLFTAGIDFDKSSREAFDLSLTNAIDKQLRVRAWSWSPEKTRTGEFIPEEERTAIQQLKVVKDFSNKKSKPTDLPF